MNLRVVLWVCGLGLLLGGCASSAPVQPQPEAKLQNAESGNANMVTGSSKPRLHPQAPPGPNMPELTADEREFVREVAQRHQLPQAQIAAVIAEARLNPTVLRYMAPPPPAADAPRRVRHWPGYRKRFVEPVRIKAGTEFWQEHADILAEAEREYGVPAAVIVAILGVETVYGRVTGNFNVLDALYTLAFHWPEHARRDRSPYFRGELETYVVDSLQYGKQPRAATGSFAGAVGMPQFMPSSIRDYAVSTTPGAPPDLHHNVKDVVFSVANYLVEHGWQPGLPVFVEATLPDQPERWADGKLEPSMQWSTLAAAGAQLRHPPMAGLVSAPFSEATLASRDPAVGVIDLEYANGPVEYRIATPNFYAITQYNRSYFYATAVADLAQAIESRY